MKNHTKPLEELVQGLPPEIRKEVKAFVTSLIRKREKKPRGVLVSGLTFDLLRRRLRITRHKAKVKTRKKTG